MIVGGRRREWESSCEMLRKCGKNYVNDNLYNGQRVEEVESQQERKKEGKKERKQRSNYKRSSRKKDLNPEWLSVLIAR